MAHVSCCDDVRHPDADQRVAEAEAAFAKARGRAEMAHALAALPEDAGDEDIVDVSEPYDAALHDAPPPPPAAVLAAPDRLHNRSPAFTLPTGLSRRAAGSRVFPSSCIRAPLACTVVSIRRLTHPVEMDQAESRRMTVIVHVSSALAQDLGKARDLAARLGWLPGARRRGVPARRSGAACRPPGAGPSCRGVAQRQPYACQMESMRHAGDPGPCARSCGVRSVRA